MGSVCHRHSFLATLGLHGGNIEQKVGIPEIKNNSNKFMLITRTFMFNNSKVIQNFKKERDKKRKKERVRKRRTRNDK